LKKKIKMENLFFLLYVILIGSSFASHLRFGTIFWQPVSNSTNSVTMLVTHSWAWRLTYDTTTYCDNTVISSGTLMGINDDLLCDVGCFQFNQVVGDTRMYCTAFSTTDDWSMGYRSYNVIFPITSNAEIYYQNTAWVTLQTGGTGTWSVRAKINTEVRSDIGKINSSPLTSSAPSYCIRHGYRYQIVLPIADPNPTDDLRCRWSSKTPTDECGSICGVLNSIANLTYSKSSAGYQCMLTFNAALATSSSAGG
jgi:hypothetical protein